MRHFIRANCRIVFMLAALAAGNARGAQATWPVPPSRLSLSTPYGTLHVKTNDYIYESVLMFDKHAVDPKIEGIINITYAFSMPHARAALVSVNQGSYQCPISYRWVFIDKKGYTVSPPFGSCSQHIKVSADGHDFTMETPNAQKPNKIDVYIYDGKTIRHRTQP